MAFGLLHIRDFFLKRPNPLPLPAERWLTTSVLTPLMRDGHITLAEAKALTQIVKQLQANGPIIEIGTLFGHSTSVIAIAAEDREIITVDNYSWNPAMLRRESHIQLTTSALSGYPTVKIVDSDATDFFLAYKGAAPAMAFIDADHSYDGVRRDIEGCQRIGCAVICGHDYSAKRFPGVVRAVDEAGGASHVTETLWVLRQG